MSEQIPSKSRSEEWYKEVEELQRQIIDNAIKTGTVIPAERLFEPYQRYDLIARRLAIENDGVKAFAILDDIVKREVGSYHISIDGTKVWRNTDNTDILKDMIYNKLSGILEATPKNKQALSFLARWKAQPAQTDKTPIPDELKTDRAIKAIDKAIARGIIEHTPDGLKWRGIGTGKNITQLAYFCVCVWCPTNTEKLPETSINDLFNVKRIGSYVNGLLDVKKPQKWRVYIDSLFIE